MFTRGRRLSLAAAVVLLTSGLLQSYAAFGSGGMNSWWQKAGAFLMFVAAVMYMIEALMPIRGANRDIH